MINASPSDHMSAGTDDQHLLTGYCVSATRFLDVGRGKGQDLVVKKISYGEEKRGIYPIIQCCIHSESLRKE